MTVDPKHHPNIIGRRGATINKIRDDHDVRIQLPDKDGPNSDEITIMGYEHNVKGAQDDILRIVRELVSEEGGRKGQGKEEREGRRERWKEREMDGERDGWREREREIHHLECTRCTCTS